MVKTIHVRLIFKLVSYSVARELAVVLHIMTDKIYKPRIEDTIITDRLDRMISECQTCERPDEHPSELTNHICINDHEVRVDQSHISINDH